MSTTSSLEEAVRAGAHAGAREAITEGLPSIVAQVINNAASLEPRRLTVTETAEHLHVHPDSIRRWISCEKAPALNVGGRWKINLTEFEAWLQQRSQKA